MTREEFQSFIDASALSPEQKQLWGDIILTLDDFQFGVLAEAAAQDTSALALLTENIEMKKKAFQSADKNLFDQILQKEKTVLE